MKRLIVDLAAFMNILNSRTRIQPEHATGLPTALEVQGKGTHFAKGSKYKVGTEDRENQFDRVIYNLKANSLFSMLRDENKALVGKVINLYKQIEANRASGADVSDAVEAATELANEYLNAIQMTFSVIQPSSYSFADGDVVKCKIEVATNKAGQQQLIVKDVRPVATVTIAKTKLDVTDLITSEEGADVFSKDAKAVTA